MHGLGITDPMVSALQQAGAQAHAVSFLPPRRYGTAFHLAPPFADMRSLAASSAADVSDLQQSISRLSASDQRLIRTTPVADPYTAWHIAHLDRLDSSVIVVPPGASRRLHLSSAALQAGAPRSRLHWIIVGEGASLTVEDWVENTAIAFHHLFLWQKAGSSVDITSLRAANAFMAERWHLHLLAPRAAVRVRQLVVCGSRQQADMNIRVYHRAPRTQSTVCAQVAAAARGTAVWRGRIDVDETARGISGYQHASSLLLAPRAVVDLLPELDIRTNDVRCSHGAAATHLNDETLYYLRSRGLSRQQARRLAVLGFFRSGEPLPRATDAALEKTANNL